jgi:hypothetical protein
MKSKIKIFDYKYLYGKYWLACLGGVVAALVFGYSAAILPPSWLIMFGLVSVGGVLSIFYPIIAGGAVLVLSFGLLPFVPIDYRVYSELAIYGSMIIVFILSCRKNSNSLELLKLYSLPLILFSLAWIVALFFGLRNGYAFANADARRYVGFLAFFIFSTIEMHRRGSGLRILISVSTLASAMLILQMISGWRVFAGYGGYWESVSKGLEDVTRGTASGGNYLIGFSLYYCLLQASKLKEVRYLLGSVFFLVAIVSTYSRGFWAGVIAGIIMLAVFYRSNIREVMKIFGFGLLGLIILSGSVYIVRPRVIEAVVVRTLSVLEEGGKGTSLGARLDENQQAIEAAKGNWIFGMGHGAEYKKFLNVSEVGFANQITFIHNSYLWVVVKLGLLGVFSIGLLVFSTFRQSKFALLKGGNSQIVGIAGASTIIVFMVTGLTSPVWGQSSDLVAFSLLAICLASAANSSIERNI